MEMVSTKGRKLFLPLYPYRVLGMHMDLGWLSGPSLGPLQAGQSRKCPSLSPPTPKLALSLCPPWSSVTTLGPSDHGPGIEATVQIHQMT